MGIEYKFKIVYYKYLSVNLTDDNYYLVIL